MSRIPFNRPSLEGRESDYMREAVEGGHTSADGPFSARAGEILREAIGSRDVLLTTSCTAALEMSAAAGFVDNEQAGLLAQARIAAGTAIQVAGFPVTFEPSGLNSGGMIFMSGEKGGSRELDITALSGGVYWGQR